MKICCFLQEHLDRDGKVLGSYNIYLNIDHITAVGPCSYNGVIEPENSIIVIGSSITKKSKYVVKHTPEEVIQMLKSI